MPEQKRIAPPCVCGHRRRQHRLVRMSVELLTNPEPLYEIPNYPNNIAWTKESAPYKFQHCTICGCSDWEELRPEEDE
jgi:hypothetical protein